MLTIIHAKIITMDEMGIIEDGFIRMDGCLIQSLGNMKEYISASSDAGEVIVDACGAWILPGFIDAHSHLGLFDDSLDFEGNDGNEDSDPVTPQLRALDGIHSGDICFREAYEAGVSVVMTGPGSGNVLGGQFALVRTYERTVDRAVICEPCAQKVALGENPKRVYGKESKAPATRMGTASLLRDTLYRATEYRDKWNEYQIKMDAFQASEENTPDEILERPERPDYDMQMDSMLAVLSGDLPLKIHAHRQDDILTAIRLCNEFGLTYTLDHCTEGHLIADVLREEYLSGQQEGRGLGNRSAKGGKLIGIIVGPIIGDRSKPELSAHTLRTAGVLSQEGIPIAIMTDHPSVPQQYLSLSAALAVRGGMNYEEAISAITITAARLCGISDQYGSLVPGKRADLTLFSGDPLEYRSTVIAFIGGGVVKYDPSGRIITQPKGNKHA